LEFQSAPGSRAEGNDESTLRNHREIVFQSAPGSKAEGNRVVVPPPPSATLVLDRVRHVRPASRVRPKLDHIRDTGEAETITFDPQSASHAAGRAVLVMSWVGVHALMRMAALDRVGSVDP
jgi:hypothetical protein